METLWFCLVALMVAVYVVLDGFDLGSGILHLLVARSDRERRSVIGSIGPVWDGNEVWLLAAGGVMYFAFPALYASSFSGFYLPLMMVLWLLVLRGLSLELRSHVDSGLWQSFWDVTFGLASTLLAVFFGAALGNVVRGVPLHPDGFFFLPLWTNFLPGQDAGILDWYTVSIGGAAFLALVMHGSSWLVLKNNGDLQERARLIGRRAWWGVVAFTALITALSFWVQPHLGENFTKYPWGYIFPALAIAGLIGVRLWQSKQAELLTFLASTAYLCGMLTSAAFGVYPYVLASNGDPNLGLTVYNSAAPGYGLSVGLRWWAVGMILAAGYFVFVYRHFAGKVSLDD
ncbi:MAG: cytochrome d ubiquinol oxidase subunit II [Bryobacteraceae bacterium]